MVPLFICTWKKWLTGDRCVRWTGDWSGKIDRDPPCPDVAGLRYVKNQQMFWEA